jgi:anaerobic magnesium-protoporphyrin IX monomethyl ester cyclase
VPAARNDQTASLSSGRRSWIAIDVLLVFPGRFKAPDPQVPLQLLHVASALQRAGHQVRIVDTRLHDMRTFDLGDPVFVGVTCMSGPQIRYALEFAARVRAERPGVPIVWGGVHPTLLPEQTAASEFVDIVVRGESELVVGPLTERLAAGEPLDDVNGLTFRSGGEICSTPDAALIDLDEIPVELPFDLLDLDRYPTLQSGRVHMQTSRGCPSRCGFCYNTGFNKRRWRGKSAARVVDEMEFLLRRFPHVQIIDPVDDNLFVDRKRVEAICHTILDRGVKVAWRANCRFDYLAKYDADFVGLLERAGCMELDFGGESGSPPMQEFVCKDVTAGEIVAAVANLQRWAPSIDPFVSWLSGLPGETYADMEKTFDLMDEMGRVNPRTQHYGIFLYTPFPSPLLESLPEQFAPPQSLKEWGGIEVFHFLPPWHTKRYVEKLRAISAVTRYAFYPQSRIDEHGWAFRAAYGVMNRAARYRWRHRFFAFPVELKLANFAAQRLRGFL